MSSNVKEESVAKWQQVNSIVPVTQSRSTMTGAMIGVVNATCQASTFSQCSQVKGIDSLVDRGVVRSRDRISEIAE